MAARAGLWFTICFVFQRGIQFIGMPIFTRLMSQADYGVYSSFSSWAHVLVIITSLSIYSSVFNKAMIKYGDNKDQYTSSIQFLTLVSSLVFAGIILSFRTKLALYLNLDRRCFIMMALYVVVFPTVQYWSQRQRFEFKYQSIIIFTIIESLLTLGAGIVFVIITKKGKGLALIDATVLVQLAISIFLFAYLTWKGKKVFDKEYWGWTVGLAIPLIPHYLSEVILGHADRIMINSICGSNKAAIYNIAYHISMLMTIIRMGLNGAFLPWEYKRIKSKDFIMLRAVTNMYAILMTVMTITFMLIGPEILMIAAPASYREAIYIIPVLMMGCFFIFIYVLFTNVEIYYEQKQLVALASVIAAAVNILLNYVCIRKWGYQAAGYTTAISYAIMVIMHYAFLKVISKKHEEIKSLYDERYLLILVVVVIIGACLSMLLYNNSIIRYLVTMVLLVGAFIKRKTIQNLIKTIKNT